MAQDLTVLILTHNEEANIERTVESVAWAENILIVDSLSTDATCHILGRYSQVKVKQRSFDSHAKQWNYGLGLVTTPWVLTLDADYVLPNGASEEITAAMKGRCWGYEADFDYLVLGKVLRGSVLPARIVLFRVAQSSYFDDGHTQKLNKGGACGRLPIRIAHDDRKPLDRWLQSQVRYASLEADKLDRTPLAELGMNDRLRKLVFAAPPAVFLLVYVLRGGFLSGWRGLFYALQRFAAELLLSLFLIERLIKRKNI